MFVDTVGPGGSALHGSLSSLPTFLTLIRSVISGHVGCRDRDRRSLQSKDPTISRTRETIQIDGGIHINGPS
jgi:hypothetical protein